MLCVTSLRVAPLAGSSSQSEKGSAGSARLARRSIRSSTRVTTRLPSNAQMYLGDHFDRIDP
jgi:hypothetical protein